MNEEIKILIFCINDEYYAADIMEVERILGYEVPTPLPDSPPFIEGVRNYEGSILPILKLSKRFSLAEDKTRDINDSKIIVAKEGNSKLGILVDVVSEVRDIKIENIEEPPEIMKGISKRYMKGLIKFEGKIIIFLNLGSILTDDEKRAIEG